MDSLNLPALVVVTDRRRDGAFPRDQFGLRPMVLTVKLYRLRKTRRCAFRLLDPAMNSPRAFLIAAADRWGVDVLDLHISNSYDL